MLLDERAARLIAVVHAMITDSLQWVEKDEDREAIRSALEWPDIAEQRELEESTAAAAAALKAYGIDIAALTMPQPEAVPVP